ncbi:hypothetical protein JCGZ_10453 [Jatropha curcas]|uniref:Non-haem dioxygenase N-terminal domain-containing protein n=1 Tax=Jatropha curcas TaxID=180498 RepID=A0A067KLK8_JATCU|nr:hypothetical protein JCGZ_10453 [Jatropha curcas]
MAAEIESMSKSVQELAIDGKESLEKYIQKGTDSGKLNTSVPLIEVPIVDIGLLKSPLTRTEELHKLRSALSSWGCFQVINHGMTSSFLEEMRQVATQFFSLPMEEKQKYSRKTGSIEGYGNDMVLLEHQILDWTDRLYLTLNPENQRQLRFWPENPQTFRVVTNTERERMSIAVFCIPDSEKEIKPADGLIDETRPRLYKTVKDYVSFYFEYYQQGKRTIEAAII